MNFHPVNAAVGQTCQTCQTRQTSPTLLRWFRAYSRRYLTRHFHGLWLAGGGGPPADLEGRPVVVYLNHCSWWDPLIALVLAERFFPHRPAFAPIDAEQLEHYPILRRLGFFGIESGTVRGARDFLRTAEAILAAPDAMLWLTPQARFCDVRLRPQGFAAGLTSLARRFPELVFVPLALEYPFWNQRLPEALVRFGAPLTTADLLTGATCSKALTARLEQQLTRTMDTLASDAISRDPARFTPLLRGAAGVSFSYDLWRRLRQMCHRRPFHPQHTADPH